MADEPTRIKIKNLETGEEFSVSYNPPEYSLTKGSQIAEIGIPGLDSPLLQYVRGSNEKLSLKLFFDTTDEQSDVRDKTKKFYNLAKQNENTHALPKCRLSWGKTGTIKGDQTNFKGIVENISQNFTLFKSDGTPLRAELELTLREYKTLEDMITKPKSYSRTRIIRKGDTLSSIAGEEYHDPQAWRRIAEKNNIVNPKDIIPGQSLIIPPEE
jgi:nucleoid-associated protein YgaU